MAQQVGADRVLAESNTAYHYQQQEQQMGESESKSRVFKKVEYLSFETTVRELGKSRKEICEAIGYAPNSWVRWKSEGKMPQVVAIACEALRRRQGNSREGQVWLVKTQSKAHSDAIEAL